MLSPSSVLSPEDIAAAQECGRNAPPLRPADLEKLILIIGPVFNAARMRLTAEVETTPELNEKFRQAARGTDWMGVTRKLAPWVGVCVAARLLFEIADWPVTKNLSEGQSAALSNDLQVLVLIVAMAGIILGMRRE
jgi:hypothetical protein